MLLEPNHRFFKIYDLSIGARHKSSKPLDLMSENPRASTFESLSKSALARGAVRSASDSDLIHLVSMDRSAAGNLVLFFHREAWKAADPSYRKPAAGGAYEVNQYKKSKGEQQAVSCHLIISPMLKDGGYRMLLEEVPGLNMTSIMHCLRQEIFAGNFYTFKHPKSGAITDTHVTLKASGLASESLLKTLNTSRWDTVVLTKPADAAPTDGLPGMQPKPQVMKIKVDAKLPRKDYLASIRKLTAQANDAGWNDVRVELAFDDDDRSRQVAITRDELGNDIMFIRSKKVLSPIPLDNCSAEVVPKLVAEAEKIFMVV